MISQQQQYISLCAHIDVNPPLGASAPKDG